MNVRLMMYLVLFFLPINKVYERVRREGLRTVADLDKNNNNILYKNVPEMDENKYIIFSLADDSVIV